MKFVVLKTVTVVTKELFESEADSQNDAIRQMKDKPLSSATERTVHADIFEVGE